MDKTDKENNPPARTREQILNESMRLFIRFGYLGVSMRQIAEACGVSKAALYYHFAQKQDIFFTIMNDALLELGRVLDARLAGQTGIRAQVGAVTQAFFSLSSDQRAVIRLASQEMVHLEPEAQQQFQARYQALFLNKISALFTAGIRNGDLVPLDPGLYLWAYLGMIYPFLQGQTDAHIDPAVLTDLFLGGALKHE